MSDEVLSIAAYGSDRAWYDHTEGNFCGGCGNEADDCHPGQPCGEVRDRLAVLPSVCDLCPHRVNTGQIAATRTTPTHNEAATEGVAAEEATHG